MDRSQLRNLLLKIVLGALGLSSYALVASVLSFRPETEPVSTLQSMVRLPASLPGALPVEIPNVFQPEEKVVEAPKIDVLALSCWDGPASENMQTTAKWIRLTGRSCDLSSGAHQWKVDNASNGFSATVFDLDLKQLTTDYIPLQNGANEIKLSSVGEDGQVREVKMVIQRL